MAAEVSLDRIIQTHKRLRLEVEGLISILARHKSNFPGSAQGKDVRRIKGSFKFPQLAAAVVAVTVPLVLVSCALPGSAADPAAASKAGSDAKAAVGGAGKEVAGASASQSAGPAPTVSVKDGAKNVDVTVPIEVTSQGEGLASVSMTNADGREIASELSADGKTWRTTEKMGLNRTYTLVAKDKNGASTQVEFTTPSPTYTSTLALAPLPNSTEGVGQTVAVRFEGAVANKKAAQDAITVETSPHVDGAFYWVSASEVRWRPENFWEPGTTVSVNAQLYGVDLGNGMYGTEDAKTNFTIGDRVVSIVDNNTKMMQVWKNRQLVRTIPVSLGADTPDRRTPNGTYIIGDQYEKLEMDSRTYGLALDAGGYQTTVDDATQMSYSGIYVHSAPWSVWAQGNTNTSHGCVNVSPEAAKWFREFTKRGDVVIVNNTNGGTLPVTDGLGDWNLDWADWSAGNAG